MRQADGANERYGYHIKDDILMIGGIKMDKYFYSVEMDGDRKVVHIFGNIYLNDGDETETCYRIAEWTGLYIEINKLSELIDNDNFWEYVNEKIDYCGDITEKQAKEMCDRFFNGVAGIELDIDLVNEDTPCGDYWFE